MLFIISNCNNSIWETYIEEYDIVSGMNGFNNKCTKPYQVFGY